MPFNATRKKKLTKSWRFLLWLLSSSHSSCFQITSSFCGLTLITEVSELNRSNARHEAYHPVVAFGDQWAWISERTFIHSHDAIFLDNATQDFPLLRMYFVPRVGRQEPWNEGEILPRIPLRVKNNALRYVSLSAWINLIIFLRALTSAESTILLFSVSKLYSLIVRSQHLADFWLLYAIVVSFTQKPFKLILPSRPHAGKIRPQHRELRALLFAKSVWVL